MNIVSAHDYLIQMGGAERVDATMAPSLSQRADLHERRLPENPVERLR